MSLVSICRKFAGAGLGAMLLTAGLASGAHAAVDGKQCAIVGLLLGDKVAELQEALKQAKARMGDNPTPEAQAEYDDLSKTVDSLDTFSGGLVAIYFSADNIPTSEELDAQRSSSISDLIDIGNTCLEEAPQ